VTPANINIVNSVNNAQLDDDEESGDYDGDESKADQGMSGKASSIPLTPPTTMMEKEIAQTLASLVGQMLAPPTTSINTSTKGDNQSTSDVVTRWYDPGSTLHLIFKVMSSPSTSPILSVLINSATCAMMDTCGVVRMSQTLVSSCILVLEQEEEDENEMSDDGMGHKLLIDPTMTECQTPNSTVLTIVTSPKDLENPKVVSLQTERFGAPALTTRDGNGKEEVPSSSGVSMNAMFDAIGNASKVCLAVTSVIRMSVLERGVKESGSVVY